MAFRRPRSLGGASTGIYVDYSPGDMSFSRRVACRLKFAPHKYPKISKANHPRAEEQPWKSFHRHTAKAVFVLNTKQWSS
jgi:hypothetical protein